MLLGLLSDAHGNTAAVETAVERLGPVVDELLYLGDAVYGYRMCEDTVEAIRRAGMRYVLGNHELDLLGPGGERARAADGVRPETLAFLAGLPTSIDVTVGGRTLRMVHGSPFPPHGDYVVPGSDALRRCGDVGVDILLLGHTHLPMAERVGTTLVVNPGSIGESREVGARDVVSCATLDTATDEVTFTRFPNPRLAAPA